MKVVSKTIAMKLKQARDKEKAGDKGVYGKKLHANTSDVLNVQDVGRHQTFNMLHGGVGSGDADQAGRKHQIKMRRELLKREKEKRKHEKKEKSSDKDTTAQVYNDIKESMGDKFYLGYDTSDSEVEDEDNVYEEKEAEEIEYDDNGNPIKVVIDDEELQQRKLEKAIIEDNYKYVIGAKSIKRFAWDIFIIIFASINAISLPLDIAFENEIKQLDIYGPLKVLDNFTMYVFIVDMILGFFTSYINVQSGEEVFGYSFIARNYVLNGTFILDLLSTFQLDVVYAYFFGNSNGSLIQILKLFGFLKIQRLRRISKLIGQMNQTQETKALFKVA